MYVNRRLLRGLVLVLLLISTISQSTLPAFCEDEVMRLALALYKGGQYQAASDAFQKITIIQPTNIEAYVCYANSQYKLKQIDKALKAYWYVVRNFPNHKRAYEIKEYLKKLDPNFAAHAYDPTYAAFGSKLSAPSTASSTSTRRAASTSSSSSSGIIDEMVKTVRPLKNRPEVSLTLIEKTKDALKAYPPNLLKIVYDKGCRIHLTPTMIDKEPGLEHTTPPGYMEGHSFKDCPGMFYSGGIVICEYTIGNGFDWNPTSDPMGTLRHELGHAIDWYLGQVSETEEYKHAYLLDSGAITDDSTLNKLAYYMQKDIRGQHECFAELMCAKYGGRDGSKDSTTDLCAASFPRAMQVINKRIDAVQ